MLVLVVELEVVDKLELGVDVVRDCVVTVTLFVGDEIGPFSCINDESSMISVAKICEIFETWHLNAKKPRDHVVGNWYFFAALITLED
jgi:hypothetical protein